MNTSRLALTVACLSAAAAAHSHDSWFETRPLATARPGETVLALGTGNQFPKLETGIGAEYLVASGCASAGRPQALPPMRNDETSLLMRAPAGASSCWVQLTPFDVTVPPDKVPLYLKEINASPEVRAAWAAMEARGLPWRERYVKHARIELGDGPSELQPALPAKPLGMDLRLVATGTRLTAGGSVTAQVLRDGRPLPGQALELRSEDSPLGIWRRSDDQGRVTLPLPLAGRWVLRGVDLRVATDNPDRWDSRFVTLAFRVGAKAADAAATTAPEAASAARP